MDDFDIDAYMNGVGDNDPNHSDEDSDRILDNGPDDKWVPETALDNLVADKGLYPEKSMTEISKEIIDNNSPVVVQSLVHLALRSKSESTRLNAGKYLLDRALGRIGEEKVDEKENPLEKFFGTLERFANEGAQK